MSKREYVQLIIVFVCIVIVDLALWHIQIIDKSTLPDWVVASATVMAVYLALMGLETWRREKRWAEYYSEKRDLIDAIDIFNTAYTLLAFYLEMFFSSEFYGAEPLSEETSTSVRGLLQSLKQAEETLIKEQKDNRVMRKIYSDPFRLADYLRFRDSLSRYIAFIEMRLSGEMKQEEMDEFKRMRTELYRVNAKKVIGKLKKRIMNYQ